MGSRGGGSCEALAGLVRYLKMDYLRVESGEQAGILAG